jgi:hypothetical protein
MAKGRRRRKNDDLFWAQGFAGLAVIMVDFSILIPGYRNMIIVIGTIVIVLAFVAVLGFLAYRFALAGGAATVPN